MSGLPDNIAVIEIRCKEEYGLRWQMDVNSSSNVYDTLEYRGLLEPMMENGHEVGWIH